MSSIVICIVTESFINAVEPFNTAKQKAEEPIIMTKSVKMYGYQILAGILALVATAAASFCCCYVLHQPEVPKNLKKFSKN